MRLSPIQLLAAIVVLAGLTFSARAEPRPPQTYSYVQDPGISIMGRAVIRVVRDGPLEAVDQILPVGPGRTKEFHSRVVYDFKARTITSVLVSDPSVPCSVMTYTSPVAPREFDVITGAADFMKDFPARAKPLRKEKVNGIPAKVLEVKDGQAKQAVWIADPGGFPVKVVTTPAGKPPVTVLEVKKLSFARPPASAFARPRNCKRIEGESTATGGHAELGTGASASKPTTKVTKVTLRPVSNYSGPCPARIKLTGTITADKPGKVFYQFGAGTMAPGETIAFGAAGTKNVSGVLTFGEGSGPGTQIGVSAILQAIGEDASGKHDFFMESSNNADFTITCTDGGAAEEPAVEAAPAAPGNPRVTAVELKVTPTRYKGACPVPVKLVGTLKSDGPGTAYFQFQAGALGANREGTIQVGADGTVSVTSEAQVRSTPAVQSVRFLGGMEPRGHQENAQWADVDLDIRCTN